MAEQDQWCFSWFAGPADDPGRSRAALVKANKWTVGEVIRIAFLDGDADVQGRVKELARRWTGDDMADLRFSFINDPGQSDIRISFRHRGNWSTIGTTCRTVSKDQATMNFGGASATTPEENLRRVVLHEFGHALGLIHEHQNPHGTQIPWNRPQVIRDLSGPPNRWDEATIERNMFKPYEQGEVNGTGLDTQSIMIYPIPEKWVTDPKFVVGFNTDLSQKDREFIREQYS